MNANRLFFAKASFRWRPSAILSDARRDYWTWVESPLYCGPWTRNYSMMRTGQLRGRLILVMTSLLRHYVRGLVRSVSSKSYRTFCPAGPFSNLLEKTEAINCLPNLRSTLG